MEEKNQSIGNSNSILNDSRTTDSYNTANSHNVDNHSVDNHSVDSHNTQVINNHGMSVDDVLKIAQKLAEQETKNRELEEKLKKQQNTPAESYSRSVDLSQVEPIPGSEAYRPRQVSQGQTSQQPSSSTRQTVVYEPQKRSSHLGTIVAVICCAVLAGGIFLFTGKKSDTADQTAKLTEVVVPEQKQQPVVSQTSSAPKKQRTQTQTSSKSTTSTARTTTATATTTTQQAVSAPKQEYVPMQEVQSTPQTRTVNPFDEAKTKADAGDAASCYKVAKAYQEGNGVSKSLSSAFQYMKAAADKGYTPAYIEVAKMYHGGRGVTKDRDVAEQWYKKAADAGNAEAKRILLNM